MASCMCTVTMQWLPLQACGAAYMTDQKFNCPICRERRVDALLSTRRHLVPSTTLYIFLQSIRFSRNWYAQSKSCYVSCALFWESFGLYRRMIYRYPDTPILSTFFCGNRAITVHSLTFSLRVPRSGSPIPVPHWLIIIVPICFS